MLCGDARFVVSVHWRRPESAINVHLAEVALASAQSAAALCCPATRPTAMAGSQASMGVMISGLALMKLLELFIDPVAIAQITHRVSGVAVFICLVGAVANWLASVVTADDRVAN